MKSVAFIGVSAQVPEKFGLNNGNLLHAEAARSFFVEGEELGGYRKWTASEASEIRERCSHLVFVAANGIRPALSPSAENNQKILEENLASAQLPVTTLGLGIQWEREASSLNKNLVPKVTLRLLRTIAELSPSSSIGVRGGVTAELLASMGIAGEPIGCPSVLHPFGLARGTTTSPDVLRLRPAVSWTSPVLERDVIKRGMESDWAAVGQAHVAEERFALEQVWAPDPALERLARVPDFDMDAFRAWLGRRFVKFSGVERWLMWHQSNSSIYVGSRFHGGIASMLAGVPTLWIEIDARLRELTDLMSLPKIAISEAGTLPLDEMMSMAQSLDVERVRREAKLRFDRFLVAEGLAEVLRRDEPPG